MKKKSKLIVDFPLSPSKICMLDFNLEPANVNIPEARNQVLEMCLDLILPSSFCNLNFDLWLLFNY